jgi:hypothetical protein
MDENEQQKRQVFTAKQIFVSITRIYVNLKSLTSAIATAK